MPGRKGKSLTRESSAEERIKLFKLIWDAIGTEFGGRHHQYEMFYAGAPYVAKGYAFRNYRYEEAVQMVDAFLRTYSLEGIPSVPAPAPSS